MTSLGLPEMADTDYAAVVGSLDNREDFRQRHAAIDLLVRAGEEAKPAMLDGLRHKAWRVRHGCLRALDHAVIDDDIRVAVVGALSDNHRRVRQAALHLLACVRCKPAESCEVEGVDVEGVALWLAGSDPSVRVRVGAASYFMWRDDLEDRVVEALTAVAAGDDDIEVRRRAAAAVAWTKRPRG